MRFTLSILAVLSLAVCAFGQAGEDLPSFSGRILQAATTPVNGTNEIQTITIGGTPTAGSFTLKFDGQTTSAITWTATDATLVSRIDTALEALTNIGASGVTTTAGTVSSGIGTITVTFTGNNAKKNVSQMTVTSSLTGTSPTIAVTTSTAGVTADGRIAAKGTLLVDIAHGTLYQNTGTPPNPTWVLSTSAAITVPTVAVADIATADATDLTAAEALANANKAKINDLLAKLRTAGIVTP